MRTPSFALALFLATTACAGGLVLDSAPAFADPAMKTLVGYVVAGRTNVGFYEPELLDQIYAAHNSEPLWLDRSGVGVRARALAQILMSADAHGLNPDDYHASIIKIGIDGARKESDLFKLDVLLTDGLMRYAHDVRAGRVNPKNVRGGSHMQQREVDVVAVVQAAAGSSDLGAYLASLPPQSDYYAGQVKALAALRQSHDWSAISSGGKLELGVTSSRVAALRSRLAETGELGQAAHEGETFDKALDGVVREYQARNGLSSDGVVGPATLAMLNTSREERIEQMVANMERQRWLPDDMGQRYVLVNVPAYELFAVSNGSVDLRMKTIVGRRDRQTPIFSDMIEYVDFNPTWSVPPTIATRDVLPHLKQDPGYALVHKNLHIYRDGAEIDPYSVDWHSANIHRYTLRAPPGPRNPLGTVKFIFPNPYSVYLHDTSEPGKFSQDERALSSGCVRVSEPAALANWILGVKPDWSDAKRQAILNSKRMTRVHLDQDVPVWLTYTTAWGDEAGHPVFRPDIYSYDDSVINAVRKAYGDTLSLIAASPPVAPEPTPLDTGGGAPAPTVSSNDEAPHHEGPSAVFAFLVGDELTETANSASAP